jgi:aquaporin TIP
MDRFEQLTRTWTSSGTRLGTKTGCRTLRNLLTEFILTFLLMTSVFGTAVDERGKAVKIGGFGIGLTVAFDILAGGAVSGASMNPARWFAPGFQLMFWQSHWAYWLAPIAEAITAALLYEHVLLRPMRPAVDSRGR